MKNFLNLESRENGADDTVVSLTINPTSISFPPSKTVTNWVPIKQQFKELGISGGATIRWEEKHILTRYRKMCSDLSVIKGMGKLLKGWANLVSPHPPSLRSSILWRKGVTYPCQSSPLMLQTTSGPWLASYSTPPSR
jgi:hypothetical protein